MIARDARDYSLIPEYTIRSLTEYAEAGRPLSHFLRAVVENDLTAACSHADSNNAVAIVAIAIYVYNRMPAGCHGSPSMYVEWCKLGGIRGIRAASTQREPVG